MIYHLVDECRAKGETKKGIEGREGERSFVVVVVVVVGESSSVFFLLVKFKEKKVWILA